MRRARRKILSFRGKRSWRKSISFIALYLKDGRTGEKLQDWANFFCEAYSFAYRKSNNFLASQAHRPRRNPHFPYAPARRISVKVFLFSEIFFILSKIGYFRLTRHGQTEGVRAKKEGKRYKTKLQQNPSLMTGLRAQLYTRKRFIYREISQAVLGVLGF